MNSADSSTGRTGRSGWSRSLRCWPPCSVHRPRSGPRARASRQRAGPAPYDLRHAALSLWLNAGGDPAQIAAQAGNSVAVLLTAYSHCIHGQDDLLNQQIGHVLEPPAGRRPCPSVEKPAVAPTARRAQTPSAIRPWIPLPARRRPADHADAKRKHTCTATLEITV
jgi:hypothetical protein